MPPFWKVQATGNDFVLLDARQGLAPWGGLAELSAKAPRWCDRHLGVGADGLLVVGPGDAEHHARMDVVNADGSLPEMCGNGLRAVAAWLATHGGLAGASRLSLATPAGTRQARRLEGGDLAGAWEVELGRPELRRGQVPWLQGPPEAQAIEEALGVGDETVLISVVSMGNPHAVVVVPELDAVPLADWGPRIEHHPSFPRGANVGFLQVLDPHHARLKVWERGAGATMACGTGSAAALVVGHLSGRLAAEATLRLPGGPLQVRWPDREGPVHLAGHASTLFQGVALPEIDPADFTLS